MFTSKSVSYCRFSAKWFDKIYQNIKTETPYALCPTILRPGIHCEQGMYKKFHCSIVSNRKKKLNNQNAHQALDAGKERRKEFFQRNAPW